MVAGYLGRYRHLPEAAGKTTGQLRYTLAKLVITIDPDAARKPS